MSVIPLSGDSNEDFGISEWMSEAIRAALPSRKFRERAREAAAEGLVLAKLQAERERVGFVALPFGKYLQGLAKLAEVSWGTVCRLAEVDPLILSEQTAVRLARFGADLGFDFRSLRAHLRVGLAEMIEEAPVPVFVAHRSTSSSRDPLVECEAALFELESHWNEEERQQVRRIEELARDGYADGAF